MCTRILQQMFDPIAPFSHVLVPLYKPPRCLQDFDFHVFTLDVPDDHVVLAVKNGNDTVCEAKFELRGARSANWLPVKYLKTLPVKMSLLVSERLAPGDKPRLKLGLITPVEQTGTFQPVTSSVFRLSTRRQDVKTSDSIPNFGLRYLRTMLADADKELWHPDASAGVAGMRFAYYARHYWFQAVNQQCLFFSAGSELERSGFWRAELADVISDSDRFLAVEVAAQPSRVLLPMSLAVDRITITLHMGVPIPSLIWGLELIAACRVPSYAETFILAAVHSPRIGFVQRVFGCDDVASFVDASLAMIERKVTVPIRLCTEQEVSDTFGLDCSSLVERAAAKNRPKKKKSSAKPRKRR
ncbi:MAG: uncharacterized protein KVP18_003564 [Porospora cf. gigantea A]|uniref:uncharacterized protein n=2 Tax=Porospora cf. gigantea A TaxID=2853593 RepID=UPI003559A20E|nr:MAG: hypothetical protein KVP18_003564 [Porospora cf. gigantea A]